jgi:diguanylate cyclase (GGDEF)-like protein/PAS domain S-box-containing protein
VLSVGDIPAAALIVARDGEVEEGNVDAAECLAVAHAALRGAVLPDLVDPGDALRSLLGRSDPEPWSLEARLRSDRGRTVDISGRLVDRDAGRSLLVLQPSDGPAPGELEGPHYAIAFEASPIGMALYNVDGEFTRVNDAMCRLLGRTRESVIGVRDQELTHPDDRQSDLDAAERIFAGELDRWQTEKRFVRPDDEVVWVIANLTFHRDADDRPLTWLGLFQDITEHRRLAERDPLTDLHNRRSFERSLADHVRHAARYGGDGAVVLFDLDEFKAINDRFGHHAGDVVLQTVAEAMVDRLRQTDVVARLGGDEFAVVLPHADPGAAEYVGRTLVSLVGGLGPRFDGSELRITSSVGVAPFAVAPNDPDAVLRAADRALYEAKRAGGDTCRLAPTSDDVPV